MTARATSATIMAQRKDRQHIYIVLAWKDDECFLPTMPAMTPACALEWEVEELLVSERDAALDEVAEEDVPVSDTMPEVVSDKACALAVVLVSPAVSVCNVLGTVACPSVLEVVLDASVVSDPAAVVVCWVLVVAATTLFVVVELLDSVVEVASSVVEVAFVDVVVFAAVVVVAAFVDSVVVAAAVEVVFTSTVDEALVVVLSLSSPPPPPPPPPP